MTTSGDFLSCDWGTSSFRLRLVSCNGETIAGEFSAPAGVKSVHAGIPDGERSSPTARERTFREFFTGKVRDLHGKFPWAGKIPAVISGMASSTVGWKELPYASTPFPLDGSALVYDRMNPEEAEMLSDVYLLSGLATGEDILRGEETEMVGMFGDATTSGLSGDAVVILPGTHSKHIQIAGGHIIDFRTYMTGELFELLATQSLLKVSVQWPVGSAIGDTGHGRDAAEAFIEGVNCARGRGLASSLFRVRTRSVLDKVRIEANSWFLSGLLIGDELLGLAMKSGREQVGLAGAGQLRGPYRMALEQLGLGERLEVIPEAAIGSAPARAHARFLARVYG